MRAYVDKKETVYQIPEFMLDISRLKKGNCLAQFFAIFMLPEFGKSTAELSPEKKNQLSHRGKALRMMKEKLKEVLKDQ